MRFEGKYCDIADDVIVGEGTKIWSWVYIGKGSKVGKRCTIANMVHIDRDVDIGDDCSLQAGVILNQKMKIGNRVWISGGVVFSDEKYPKPGAETHPSVIEDDVTIGIGALFVGGPRLGKGCIIGAGAVVMKDVPPGVTVVGNPGRILL